MSNEMKDYIEDLKEESTRLQQRLLVPTYEPTEKDAELFLTLSIFELISTTAENPLGKLLNKAIGSLNKEMEGIEKLLEERTSALNEIYKLIQDPSGINLHRIKTICFNHLENGGELL